MQLTQINLQPHFGGGEVYTAFLSQALDCLGVSTILYTHPKASFWGQPIADLGCTGFARP